MNRAGKYLIECLYPNKCAACGEILGDESVLCEYCKSCINQIDYKNWCSKCGQSKDVCRCNSREFRFLGVTAAYINEGAAKKAYYSYKFGRRKELGPFFAEKTANAVRTVFGDMEFDALMCVPNTKRSLLRRGFDHGNSIALLLSKKLDLPYVRGVLRVRAFRKPQHKSEFVKRLENVRGKYYTVKSLNLNRVLLFDDIFTTGSTLDECAKELMFAGVREVYCASVLSVRLRKRPAEPAVKVDSVIQDKTQEI